MKRFVVSVVVAMSGSGLVLVGQTPALAHHSLNGYHWTKPSGGDRKIDVRIYHLQYERQFRDAIAEWGERTEFAFSITSTDSNCNIPSDDNRMKVCDGNYGNTGWSGVTDVILRPDGRHISRGRLRLNTYYRTDASIARSIWCHEAGHLLGLDHRGTTGTTADDPDSCMSYHPSAPQRPDQHDVDQLNCQTHNEGSEGGCGGDDEDSDGGCLLGIVCFGSTEQSAEPKSESNGANVSVIRRKNGEILIRTYIPAPALPVVGPSPTGSPVIVKQVSLTGSPFSMAFRCVW